jgi:hypothetical protein
VSTTKVAAPDGGEALLIKCNDTEDCYDRAAEECHGTYSIIASQARSVSSSTGPGASWSEMTIKCSSTDQDVSGKPSSPGATGKDGELSEATPPSSAGGYDFGQSVDDARAACVSGSFKWEGDVPRFRCSGTPVDTGLSASAKLSVCKGEICRIELEAGLTEGDTDPMQRLTKVLDKLKELYGAPTRHDVLVNSSCSGPALTACLEDHSAYFRYEWRWRSEEQVVLSLGSKPPKEGSRVSAAGKPVRLRIQYSDGRKVDSGRSSAQSAAPAEGIQGL